MPFTMISEEDTALLAKEGMIEQIGEHDFELVSGSPKYIRCEEGHWLETVEGDTS